MNQPTSPLPMERLAALAKRVDEVEQRGAQEDQAVAPKPTLEILKKGNSEGAWQKLLQYFLDPGEPHGLDDAFASGLVDSLQDSGIVRSGLDPDYGEVIIERETLGDSSRPDLLMYEPGRWFICFELKVHHGERPGQTTDHVNSDRFGTLNKSDMPEEHHYYLYIALPWAGDGEAEEFEAVPWAGADERPTVVGVISEILDSAGKDLPQRTVTQLAELRDTIKGEINMTKIDKSTEELKNLYQKHRPEIEQVLEAKEEYADWFFKTRVPAALNGEYAPSYWEDDWEYNSYDSHTKINRESWRPGGDIDAHMEYYPRAEKLFGGEVHIRFDIEFKQAEWKTDDGRRPQQVFADELLTELDVGVLPDDAEITKEESSGIHKFLDIRYEFAMESEDDYLEALKAALEDLEPLVPAVDAVIERWNEVAEDASGSN